MSKGSLVIRPIAEQNSSSENQIFIEQSKDVKKADSKTNLSADADKLTVNGSNYPYETAASLVD